MSWGFPSRKPTTKWSPAVPPSMQKKQAGPRKQMFGVFVNGKAVGGTHTASEQQAYKWAGVLRRTGKNETVEVRRINLK